MELSITERKLTKETIENSLVKTLKSRETDLGLQTAVLFNEFPVYKDLDEDIIVAQILLISSKHGIIIFKTDDSIKLDEFENKLNLINDNLDNLYSILFTRLLRNKKLRKNKRELLIPINTILYAPNLQEKSSDFETDTKICLSNEDLINALNEYKIDEIDFSLYAETKSTIEGSKALLKTKYRDKVSINSKGDVVNKLEKEIASFDLYQRSAYTGIISGVNRIRGLAGSGKTIVLAMKAAITHLKYPNARIAYTYYTKSLYQHIKKLITRFYRQFEDSDPDWDKLEIAHAWGSFNNPGIYYNACKTNDITPLSYSFAAQRSKNAFDYVCKDFLSSSNNIKNLYDFMFIDEGQDFPPSFLQLCLKITKDQKLLWAYDELQTIFLPETPSAKDIFGQNSKGEPLVDFEEDIILYKCYRNPREIILVAHAVGFGIYGDIVQMIENAEYWEDIGYKIISGNLQSGEEIKIERPKENSLESISNKYSIDEIIRIKKYNSYKDEILNVANEIHNDIKNGLLPEDILVITVDDRNATKYLNHIQEILSSKYRIKSNNIHADKYSNKNFQIEGRVTLSTVHKAKGNEAYSVYIVGTESLFSINPSIRERNILFTAMTRSKAWLFISGIGDSLDFLINEIKLAKQNFPYLIFKYPEPGQLRIMKRDIKEKAVRKSKSKKLIEDALKELSPEEIKRYVDQISENKKL